MMYHKTSRLFCSALLALSIGVPLGANTAEAQETYRFSRIDIVGNERLSDDEVRAACDLSADRVYTDADLAGAVNCLGQTGRFNAIDLDTDGRALVVTVDERPDFTGLLDLSVSLDTDRGLSGRLYIEDRDLLDRGWRATGELELSAEEQTLTFGLADPTWRDGASEGGLTLGAERFDYDDALYSSWRLRFGPYIRIPVGDRQLLSFRAGLQADDIYDVGVGTSPVIAAEAGRRDSVFTGFDYGGVVQRGESDPWMRYQLSQDLVGLGEDHLMSISRLRGQAVSDLVPSRLSFSLTAEAGHVANLGGEPSKVIDRFSLGGTTLRGFAPRGIGPRDRDQALGGNSYVALRLETRSPLAELGGAEIFGGVFIDAGSVWDLDNTSGFDAMLDDGLHWRASVGVSLGIEIGRTPVTLYYAEPFERRANDETQEFGISFATRF